MMRSFIVVAAAFTFAACSSSIPAPNANPQAALSAVRSPQSASAAESYELVLRNDNPHAQMALTPNPMACTAIEPDDPSAIKPGRSQSFTITLTTNLPNCVPPSWYTATISIAIKQNRRHVWTGSLDFQRSPGAMYPQLKVAGFGNAPLCTTPALPNWTFDRSASETIHFRLGNACS
jgi:hypothetical protein